MAQFLDQFVQEIDGPLTVAWDRGRIHGQSLAAHPDVGAEDLPGDALELKYGGRTGSTCGRVLKGVRGTGHAIGGAAD